MKKDRSQRSNRISPEKDPIAPGLAPVSIGLTFAQTLNAKAYVTTLLVAAYDGQTVEAVDLAQLGAPLGVDVFEASAFVGQERLRSALLETGLRSRYDIKDMLPSGAIASRHVATGTNFADHASETGGLKVFNFPKFGNPSPPLSTLVVNEGTLMDYEVEISVRFDRDIRTMADFEAARKGFFLCGDFTDRATLVRLVDRANIASGKGFSDAKSGPDFFPTGPFLVIPHDWREFVSSERIVTRVNGHVKQDARGQQMILDFEAIVEKALTNGGGGSYIYKGKPVPLLEKNTIERGSAVMSGTCAGVLFMPLLPEDKSGGMFDHITRLRFLRGEALVDSVVRRFIKNETKAKRYLQVGDQVEHLASTLGMLKVTLISPAPHLNPHGKVVSETKPVATDKAALTAVHQGAARNGA